MKPLRIAGADKIRVNCVNPVFSPETGLSAERTHFAFGVAEQWSLLARVIAVRPRGEQMEITCVAEHSAVHSADGSVDSGTDPI